MRGAKFARAGRKRKLVARSGATLQFSELGFGAAPLGNLYRPMTEKEARATLDVAWAVGCRHYDTAPIYGLGLSETRLNGFLRAKPRDAFLISTKVGRLLQLCKPEERAFQNSFFETPSRREIFDYSYDGVMRSLEFSLERLGLDRIDIVYCARRRRVHPRHARGGRTRALREFMDGGYKALVKLRDSGAIQAIGAGLNEWEVAETMARAGDFDVFLLAGRYTLLEQEALQSFLPYCVDKKIGVVIGGPFNSGVLATGAEARRALRLPAGAAGNPRPRPPDRGGLQGPRGQARRSGAALSAQPSGGRQRHPRRPEGRAKMRRNAAMLDATIPATLWRAIESRRAVAPRRADAALTARRML